MTQPSAPPDGEGGILIVASALGLLVLLVAAGCLLF
jgi:hypothetical protein